MTIKKALRDMSRCMINDCNRCSCWPIHLGYRDKSSCVAEAAKAGLQLLNEISRHEKDLAAAHCGYLGEINYRNKEIEYRRDEIGCLQKRCSEMAAALKLSKAAIEKLYDPYFEIRESEKLSRKALAAIKNILGDPNDKT
ncbi:hypothetical protein [Dehalobacter restrictus]|uniref:hypothetical protein n=1 Tax=Dehalobacter restrictus TaxID=55583 RepID=UPI00338FEE8A